MTENESTKEHSPFANPLLSNAPIIVGVLLIAALFMPWLSIFGNISGLDLIKAGSQFDINYSWTIAIPAGVGILTMLVSTAKKDPLIYGIPAILLLLYLIQRLVLIGQELGVRINDLDDIAELTTNVFNIGFWVTLLSLLSLCIISIVFRKQLTSNVVPGLPTAGSVVALIMIISILVSSSVFDPTSAKPEDNSTKQPTHPVSTMDSSLVKIVCPRCNAITNNMTSCSLCGGLGYIWVDTKGKTSP